MFGGLPATSKEEELRELQDENNKEDIFDVFIRYIVECAPLVYIVINLILIIWIAQTILNSKLSPLPKSLYLMAPYFNSFAINRI